MIRSDWDCPRSLGLLGFPGGCAMFALGLSISESSNSVECFFGVQPPGPIDSRLHFGSCLTKQQQQHGQQHAQDKQHCLKQISNLFRRFVISIFGTFFDTEEEACHPKTARIFCKKCRKLRTHDSMALS